MNTKIYDRPQNGQYFQQQSLAADSNIILQFKVGILIQSFSICGKSSLLFVKRSNDSSINVFLIVCCQMAIK